MKLHEVISTLNGDMNRWFRPVGWAGAGIAYVVKDGGTHLVPTGRGGERSMTCDPIELAGDWEIVTPDVVLGERN